MEREIKGYIKFKDKKAIMKPMDGKSGLIETWEASDSFNSKQYFVYLGTRYQFVSAVDPK